MRGFCDSKILIHCSGRKHRAVSIKEDIMTKKEYNIICKSLMENNITNFDMLMQAYTMLDKQVSKFAYLKKKWANGGMSNECYADEFTTAIRKRNVIEQTLKTEFDITTDDIKYISDKTEIQLTKANCEALVDLVKSKSYKFGTVSFDAVS